MRIIAGVAGGRRLVAPSGDSTRPTSDRVREALFNILGPPPPDARVLDLFAGSGALGLEALSRGAAQALLVEQAAEPAQVIATNVTALGFADRARVLRGDVLATLPRLATVERPFHWIFIDPPYARPEKAPTRRGPRDLATAALTLLGQGDAPLVAEGGVVVIEHDRRVAPPESSGALERADVRRYGDTEVSFYRSIR